MIYCVTTQYEVRHLLFFDLTLTKKSLLYGCASLTYSFPITTAYELRVGFTQSSLTVGENAGSRNVCITTQVIGDIHQFEPLIPITFTVDDSSTAEGEQ